MLDEWQAGDRRYLSEGSMVRLYLERDTDLSRRTQQRRLTSRIDLHTRRLAGASRTFAGDWALPGPRWMIVATVNQLDDPHHDYPAWDWIIPTGTPIYAVRAGTVSGSALPHN